MQMVLDLQVGRGNVEISPSLKLGKIKCDFVGCVQALSDNYCWGWVSSKRTVCPLITYAFSFRYIKGLGVLCPWD